MRTLPQAEHCDLGLVDDDRTEDLRPTYESAPGVAATTTEGDRSPSSHQTTEGI